MRLKSVAILLAAGFLAAQPLQADDTVTPTHGIAMHGSPKYAADFTHFEYVNPDAPKGGLVRMAAVGSFDSLNNFIVKGDPATGIGSIYDSLTKSAADEAFTQYGLLAESMEVPEDRSWAIFNMRTEARWHDGKPVTAEDVKWTFETVKEKGLPFFQFYYGSITNIEVLDTHRIKFTFGDSENRELPLIVGQQAILPKHYWEGRDFESTTLEPPLGSGAYMVDTLEAGRFITYKRNPDYWGKDLPVNKGYENFDNIRYDYYRDQTVLVEALKAGEFDFRVENTAKTWATGYEIPAVENGEMIKVESPHNRSAGMQGFTFNTRRDLFKDPKVREALAFGFDFEWSNQALFNDLYIRTRSYFENSELSARGLPQGEELEILTSFKDQLPPRVFTEEYQPPKTDGSGRIRKNLGQAVGLFKEAGWTIQNGKLADADGTPFVFELLLVSPAFERIALPLKKNFERLGIDMSVRVVDTAQYIKRLETYDFDMIVGVWGQSLSPGNEQRAYWGSAVADQPGGRNFAGIKDPVIDELIEKIIAAPNRESLVQRTRALDRALQWGHYVIPNWHVPFDRLIHWNKFGKPDNTPLRGVQFGTWWVDADKERVLAGKIKSVPE